jgi:hypothetical protein
MYNESMPQGRPASKPRPTLGNQIALARSEKDSLSKILLTSSG